LKRRFCGGELLVREETSEDTGENYAKKSRVSPDGYLCVFLMLNSKADLKTKIKVYRKYR